MFSNVRLLSPRSARSPVLAAGVLLLAGVAAAQGLPGQHALILQNTVTSMQVGSSIAAMVAADLDGDGRTDVVTVDSLGNQLHVLRQTAAGSFADHAMAIGFMPTAVAAVDLDGDGDLDLVVGNRTELRAILNSGAGTFTPGFTIAFAGGDLGPVALLAADVDRDGHQDLIVGLASHTLPSGSYTGGVAVAFGDGAGHLTLGPVHALALPAMRLVAADYDGDGRIDVAELGGYTTANRVVIAYGQGNGTFVNSNVQIIAGLYASGLTQGDFDGDGAVDLAVGGKYSVLVLHNDHAGNFTTAQVLTPGYYDKGLAAGDIDGDGDLDLIATSGTALAMRIYRNNGAGTFALADTLPSPLQATSVMLADTNGDGYLDAWAGDSTTGALTIGSTRALAATYGQGRANATGTVPSLGAAGSTIAGGAGLTLQVDGLSTDQPTFVVASATADATPLLGGTLLVAPPGWILPMVSSHGSGSPAISDGSVSLFVDGAQLGAIGIGKQVFVQIVAADPLLPAGNAAFSNGMWIEVARP